MWLTKISNVFPILCIVILSNIGIDRHHALGKKDGDGRAGAALKKAQKAVAEILKRSFRKVTNTSSIRKPKHLLRSLRRDSASRKAIQKFDEVHDDVLKVLNKVDVEKKIVTQKAFSASELRVMSSLTGCIPMLRLVNCSHVKFHRQYRSADGSCNNLKHELWGAAPIPLYRLLPPRYENTISEPVGWNKGRRYKGHVLPNPRVVVNELLASKEVIFQDKYTVMLMEWGQFVDHDIDISPGVGGGVRFGDGKRCSQTCENKRPCFPIKAPDEDCRLDQGECMGTQRSQFVCGTGVSSVFGDHIIAREQINRITSYLDASAVYGSSKVEEERLRNSKNDLGLLRVGKKVGQGQRYLPFDTDNVVDCPLRSVRPCFLAGDRRVNENVALLTMHTIFMRHHNLLARRLKKINPHWNGDTVYHETRKIIGAQLQHISYNFWLPGVLGGKGMEKLGKYDGYDWSIRPDIINAFSGAAFRFGHSTVPPFFHRLDKFFNPISFGHLPLHEAFFSPHKLVDEGGVDPILRGLFHASMKKPDPNRLMTTELTERLFSLSNRIALDLGSLNIQRGRDHGLPGYNEYRKICGLKTAKSFDDFSGEIKEKKIREKLAKLYGHPDNVDLFVGGLTENAIDGGQVGPTFQCIIRDQFHRIRAGDRFWYERQGVFTAPQLAAIKNTSLSAIICENNDGTIDKIQENVFLITKSIRDYKCCEEIPKLDLSPWKE